MVQVQAVILGVTVVVAIGLAIYNHFTNSRYEQPRNAYAYDDSYPDYPSGPARACSGPPRRRRKLSSCTICLGDISSTSDLRDLGCGHSFHRKCIEHWFNCERSCPNCRAQEA